MHIVMHYLTTIRPDNNPILRSEAQYQRFVIQRSRSGWLWIGLALLLVVPALLVALFYSVALLLSEAPLVDYAKLPTSVHGNLVGVLLIANLSLYPVVILVTMALARLSITREKTGRTWALLRLSEVKNRELVVGKWWASLRAMVGDHFMVIMLRVGLIAAYLGVFLPALNTALEQPHLPYRTYFVLFAPIFIIQAVLEAMLTVAIGILSAIPDDILGIVIMAAMMMLRFVTVILVGVWFYRVMDTLRHDLAASMVMAAGGMVITGFLLILTIIGANWLLERI